MRSSSLFVMFFGFLSISLNSANANIDNLLSNFKWNNRVIIVMANSPYSSDFKEQMSILSTERKRLEERDIVLIEVPNDESFKVVKSNEFQRKFNPNKENFKFILIGKDGSIKLTSKKAVSAQQIFSLIDSMPMRRMEMLLD